MIKDVDGPTPARSRVFLYSIGRSSRRNAHCVLTIAGDYPPERSRGTPAAFLEQGSARHARDREPGRDGAAEVARVKELAMAAQKDLLGLIDAGREIRRPPLVGMQFLHQQSMRTPNGLGARSRLQAKDLIGLLLCHFAAAPRRGPTPRRRVLLRVFTPAGPRAVKIRHQ